MKNKLLSIHHFIIGVILLSNGLDKIQNHHNLIGWTILLLGTIVLSFFIFIKVSKKPHSFLEIVIYFFESIALFLASYVYFQEGKLLLPYALMISGIGFLIATILHLKNTIKNLKTNSEKATNAR